VNFKKRKERFEDEDVKAKSFCYSDVMPQKELLQAALNEETEKMWERIGNRLGKSAESCRQKAKDLGLL
jgi:hypothetical protein